MKVGDKVVKSKRYSEADYCAFGGDEEDCPLGTIGIITKIYPHKIRVDFETGVTWAVDRTELDLFQRTLKDIINIIKTELGEKKNE